MTSLIPKRHLQCVLLSRRYLFKECQGIDKYLITDKSSNSERTEMHRPLDFLRTFVLKRFLSTLKGYRARDPELNSENGNVLLGFG